jgi:hypothetical protein
MASITIKIIGLTIIYLLGWYICERVFSLVKNKLNKKDIKKASLKERKKIIPLAGITPIDQTWRYIRSLKNPDWRVRKIACIQLSERRGTAVVEALIEALDDVKTEVSMAASEALTKIGDPLAIEALALHCKELEHSTNEYFETHRAA